MRWLGLVARNLLRRPGRAAFTLLGVALAVASYVALTGLARGMIEGAGASHDERGVDLIVTHRGMVDMFAGSLPDSLAAAIGSQPGVAEVAAELDTALELGDGQAVVAGWRRDQFTFREMRLRGGRLPRDGQAEVVLGDLLAEAADVDLNGEIELNFERFRVVGISAYETGYLRNMAIMPLPNLQALLARPGQATLVQVRLQQPGDADAREAARARIAALRPNLSVSTTAEAMRSSRLIQMIDSTSLAISIVALAIGCLSVLNTLAMGVEERTREIGILSAIGWSRRRILALILSEGFVLAGIGGLVGVLLGWVGHNVLVDSLTPGGGLSASAMVGQAVRAEVAALLVGLTGALVPAWRASRLAPAAALRHQ
ncbi:ABC transporter permease [Sphingosinicella sp.]|uniref:ABC transporter permease n=1 Tax=Sphingosinicella sp. TaxID=1917971 RepID=UPI004037D804